ncbi:MULTISPECIES: type II secretion system protein GspD [unclassified Thermotoga]|uniref:type II secretion system protein GspD n=1 Tax=unclassified Thermotoga TaxID=2631113 RepID=UPI0005409462|nr:MULTISPECIES: type IV pilus secretin PilQ [unclassified Thermotoga]AIY88172.1 type II and III secretion system protein [Thermotoga sp. Cell2]KHC90612.1 type II and III secretion system protein [Thermotoga sp. TBGT1765]KHC90961.1 type II and III secretion system protein [Thermotoga sp. TBGT1766]KHC96846.1 type II and III secretion system protein [Thermotoga sp. Xyl54]
MRRILLILVMLMFSVLFSAELVGVLPKIENDRVIIKIQVSSPVEDVSAEMNSSKTVFSIFMKGVQMKISRFMVPVGVGPVEGVRVVNVGNGVMVSASLLVPFPGSYRLEDKTIVMEFPRSKERIDVSFENMPFEDMVKYLSERLNLNVIVSDSVKSATTSLKLNDVTPEDALRDLLVTFGEVAYAYFPDGTMFIGKYEEVSGRFQRFWGIYRVENQTVADRIKSLISQEAMIDYLPSKSVLFVYGTSEEHDLVASLLSVSPPLQQKEVSFSVDSARVEELLTALKSVYQFEYHLLKPVSRVILVGDSETISKVERYIRILETREQVSVEEQVQIPAKKFVFYAYDPESAASLITLLLGIDAQPFKDMNLVVCQVPIDKEQELVDFIAENNLELGEMFYLDIKKGEEDFLREVAQFLGVPDSRLRFLNIDGENVKAGLSVSKAVYEKVSPILEKLLSLRRKNFIVKSVELKKEIQQEMIDAITRMYGVSMEKIGNFLFIEGARSSVENAEEQLKKLQIEHTQFLKIALKTENVEDLSRFMKEKYGVEFEYFSSLKMAMLSGKEEENVQKAAEELQIISSEERIIRFVKKTENVPIDKAKNVVSQLYSVSIEELGNELAVIGEREEVEKAADLLQKIFSSEVEISRDFVKLPSWIDEQEKLLEVVKNSAGITYEILDGVVYFEGTKENVEKAKELFSDIVEKLGEVRKEETVEFLEVDSSFPVEEFINLSSKLYPDVTCFSLDQLGLLVLKGSSEAVEDLSSIYRSFFERHQKIVKENVFDRLMLEVPSGFSFEEFKTFLEVLVPEVKQVVYLDKLNLLLVEVPVSQSEKVKSLLDTFLKKEEAVSEKKAVKSVTIPSGVNPDELSSYLKKLLRNVEITVFPNMGQMIVEGPENEVRKAVELVETEKEKIVLKEKKDYVKVSDGKLTINAEDAPLYDLLEEIAGELGISVMFVSIPSEKITMKADNVAWEKFIDLISQNYGYLFDNKNGVYVVSKPKQDLARRYIYDVPHNFDQIKALIEFYGGTVYVDSLNNFMVVTGISETIKKELDDIIEKLKKPTKQVEISAKIVDRSLIDRLSKETVLELTGGNVNVGSSGAGISFFVTDYLDFEKILGEILNSTLSLQFSDQKTNTLDDILASPRIVTTSGKEARILIGDRIPYVTDTNGDGTPEVQFLETGIELSITPFVRSDDTIELDLFVKASEPGNYINEVPGERTREAQTHLIVKNGSTITIGGLIREVTNVTESKLPFLGDLPVIGQFFRTKSENKEKRDLVIFLTVRVVEP